MLARKLSNTEKPTTFTSFYSRTFLAAWGRGGWDEGAKRSTRGKNKKIKAVYYCFLPLYLAQALVYTLCQVPDSPLATLLTLLHPSGHFPLSFSNPQRYTKQWRKGLTVHPQFFAPSG